MTFTIGRATGLRLAGVDRTGNDVTFRGAILAANNAELRARTQQLLGMVDNDDEVAFPATWTVDPNVDGYYAVRDVSVAPVGVEGGDVARFAVNARRIGDYAHPLAEALVSSVIRSNAHSIASGNSHLVVPPTTDFPGSWHASSTSVYPYSEDGRLVRNFRAAPVSWTSLTYGVAPADWYKGSSRVSLSYGGTYYPVVGKQIPRVSSVRVQNANFRVDVSSAGVFTLGLYVDPAWESSPSFVIRQVSTYDSLASVKVLRNSPELVVVRLGFDSRSVGTAPGGTVDVALHRGHQTACCLLTPWSPGTSQTASIRATTPTACTAVTGGIEQTSADAAGNKWFILSTPASTDDLTNGYRTTNAAVSTNLPFALGMYVSTGGPGDDWSPAQARDAFWAEYSETLRVVMR